MGDDKIFNLQLTIQKLEEELSLYRNGTTSSELLEMIREKDTELENAHKAIQDKTESLRKLAKSSNDVIKKYEELQGTNAKYQKEISELQQINDKAQEAISELQSELTMWKGEHAHLEAALVERNQEYEAQAAELDEANNSIVQLQSRCAELVREKTDRSRQLEKEKSDRAAQVKDLRGEVAASLEKITSLKAQLHESHLVHTDLTKQLTASQDMHSEAQKTVEKMKQEIIRLSNIVSENTEDHRIAMEAQNAQLSRAHATIAELQLAVQSATSELRATQLKTTEDIRMKEDEIQRTSSSVAAITAQLEQQRSTSEARLREREEHWKMEAMKMERMNDALRLRVQGLEAERENHLLHKRDIDALRAKNLELEDKIKRQEQYMKNRLLKDRSNTLHGPENNSSTTSKPARPTTSYTATYSLK